MVLRVKRSMRWRFGDYQCTQNNEAMMSIKRM
jgi:hypothetical protein